MNTPYDVRFRTDKENEVLCSKDLTAKELQRFRKAVQRDFYFQVGQRRPGVRASAELTKSAQSARNLEPSAARSLT